MAAVLLPEAKGRRLDTASPMICAYIPAVQLNIVQVLTHLFQSWRTRHHDTEPIPISSSRTTGVVCQVAPKRDVYDDVLGLRLASCESRQTRTPSSLLPSLFRVCFLYPPGKPVQASRAYREAYGRRSATRNAQTPSECGR